MRKGLSTTSIVLFVFTSICFADPVPDIRQGEWEITTKMEIPGMPTNIPPVKTTQCLTDKDFVPDLMSAYPDFRWTRRTSFGGLLDIPDSKGETRAQSPVAALYS